MIERANFIMSAWMLAPTAVVSASLAACTQTAEVRVFDPTHVVIAVDDVKGVRRQLHEEATMNVDLPPVNVPFTDQCGVTGPYGAALRRTITGAVEIDTPALRGHETDQLITASGVVAAERDLPGVSTAVLGPKRLFILEDYTCQAFYRGHRSRALSSTTRSVPAFGVWMETERENVAKLTVHSKPMRSIGAVLLGVAVPLAAGTIAVSASARDESFRTTALASFGIPTLALAAAGLLLLTLPERDQEIISTHVR